MTWRFARTDKTLHQTTVTVAGRRVSWCRGVNAEDGKLCLLVTTPRPGKAPTAMRHQRGSVQAFVRAPFYVGLHPPDILVPGWAHFTLTGWVDDRSMPIEAPWELCER